MALPSFCRTSITVVRPGRKTVRGTEVPDWDAATRHTVGGCSVQPVDTSGNAVSDRVAQATDMQTVLMPPNADLKRGDRVEYDGELWSVDGCVMSWPSPTGRVAHKVATIRLYEG